MSKRHQQTKMHSNTRGGSSISIDPEEPNQFSQAQGAASSDDGFVPSYEEIQRRAYQIHEQGGGSDLENWLEAERLLRKEHV